MSARLHQAKAAPALSSFAAQTSPLVQQPKPADKSATQDPAMLREVLVSGSGQPLDPPTRAFMEPAFGYNFSRVRVHADAKAAQSARSINARAYTVRSHIIFGPGRFAPDKPDGQRLLAHELTHVVQHGMGAGRSGAVTIERAEAEARRTATALPLGRVAPISEYVPPGALLMQSEEEPAPAEETEEEEPGFWGTIGGGLMGEFNEDPNFAMIGVDVGVSLIPILDQASDIRDIIAHLYYLIVRQQYDRFMRWLGLVFTLIGLIPELGSAIKGASKFVIRGVEIVLSHLADFLRPLLRLLPEAANLARLQAFVVRNWDRIVSEGIAAWNRTVERISGYVALIPTFVGGRLRALRELWGRVTEMAPARLAQAFAWVRRQWDSVVEALQRRFASATPRPRAPGDDLDEAFARLERGEVPQDAALLQDLLHHSQQPEALEQLSRSRGTVLPGRPGRTPEGAAVNPTPGYQSMHTTPQAPLRGLPHYDPGEMITRIAPTGRGHTHTVFDQFWQRDYREIRRHTGRTTTTARELSEVIARAARESGAFSRAEAESMVGLIHEDLFVRLGLSPDQVLRMPGT